MNANPRGHAFPGPRRAVTLLEVLLTLSVLAVLAGLLAPQLAAVRESARSAACAGSIQGFALATTAYSVDYRDVLPLAVYPADLRLGVVAPFEALLDYVGVDLPRVQDGQVITFAPYCCPSDRGPDPLASLAGFSYSYRPWELFAAFPNASDPAVAAPVQRSISRLIQSRPDEPLFQDARPFHGQSRWGQAAAVWNVGAMDGSVKPHLVRAALRP